MCFSSKLTKSQKEIIKHFDAEIDDHLKNHFNTGNFNAFDHPQTPVICKHRLIENCEWGLIPTWAKDKSIQNNTLNARIETLSEKPAFKSVINNRCLIIADGFYEWQWLDSKGKNKQKYLLTMPNDALYTYAGLYSDWTNPDTRQTLRTYTIITTQANELMAQIHNTKKRMPIIVKNEFDWLAGDNLVLANDSLIAHKVLDKPTPETLF